MRRADQRWLTGLAVEIADGVGVTGHAWLDIYEEVYASLLYRFAQESDRDAYLWPEKQDCVLPV